MTENNLSKELMEDNKSLKKRPLKPTYLGYDQNKLIRDIHLYKYGNLIEYNKKKKRSEERFLVAKYESYICSLVDYCYKLLCDDHSIGYGKKLYSIHDLISLIEKHGLLETTVEKLQDDLNELVIFFKDCNHLIVVEPLGITKKQIDTLKKIKFTKKKSKKPIEAPKLFNIEVMGYSGDYSFLLVLNTKEEAEKSAANLVEDAYGFNVSEIDQVDGYAVSLKKLNKK